MVISWDTFNVTGSRDQGLNPHSSVNKSVATMFVECGKKCPPFEYSSLGLTLWFENYFKLHDNLSCMPKVNQKYLVAAVWSFLCQMPSNTPCVRRCTILILMPIKWQRRSPTYIKLQRLWLPLRHGHGWLRYSVRLRVTGLFPFFILQQENLRNFRNVPCCPVFSPNFKVCGENFCISKLTWASLGLALLKRRVSARIRIRS